MTQVRNSDKNLSYTATAEPSANLPPIAPPYVSEHYYGDPAFKTPETQPKSQGLEPFPGWGSSEDEFRTDL